MPVEFFSETHIFASTKCFSSDRLPQPETSSSEEEVDDNTNPQAAGYQPLATAVNADTSATEHDNTTPDTLAMFPRAMREDFEEVQTHVKITIV